MGVRKERNNARKYMKRIITQEDFNLFLESIYLKFDSIRDLQTVKELINHYLYKNIKAPKEVLMNINKHFFYLLNEYIYKILKKDNYCIQNNLKKTLLKNIVIFLFFTNKISTSNLDLAILKTDFSFPTLIQSFIVHSINFSSAYFCYINSATKINIKIADKIKNIVKEHLISHYIMSPLVFKSYYPKVCEDLKITEKDIFTPPEFKYYYLVRTQYEVKILDFYKAFPEKFNNREKGSFSHFLLNNINIYFERNIKSEILTLLIDLCMFNINDLKIIKSNINYSYENKIISQDRKYFFYNIINSLLIKKENDLLKNNEERRPFLKEKRL